jgi:hypothetical protein
LAHKDVLEESNQVKENVSCGVPLACRNLSLAIKDLWDGRIKIVKRGKRQNQQFFYLNLRKKPSQPQSTPNMNTNHIVSPLCSNYDLPVNWTFVVDHENCLSFIRLENWTYRQNGVKTELIVKKTAHGEIEYSISCRGKEIEVNNLVQINTLAKQPFKERVIRILKLVDKCSLCQGVPVENAAIKEFVEYGVYSDLSVETSAKEAYRGFSTNCKVIVPNGTCCVSCSRFFHLVTWRKNNKDPNSAVRPNTPKCFMTKDDVVAQLEKEKQR